MSERQVPEIVLDRQREASDPAIAAFVSANAGSGKTHVLVQRVIRLLMAGADPAQILCITFTNAAAANMQDRIFGTLAEWIALPDAALDTVLAQIGAPSSAAHRQRARRLFALALEAPGGLKVQTIHALCTRLLQQFPVEAGTSAHFTVLEERDTTAIFGRAAMDVLQQAAGEPTTLLGSALNAMLQFGADSTITELLKSAVLEHGKMLRGWLDAIGGIDNAHAKLSSLFGVDAAESAAGLEAELLDHAQLPPSEWQAIADCCAQSDKDTDQKFAARLRDAVTAAPWDRASAYLRVFLTKEKRVLARPVTVAIEALDPGLAQRIKNERDRIQIWWTRHCAIDLRDRNVALLTLAAAVLDRYEAAKRQRGALDFNDLIDHTLALLTRASAAWVHYKLDRGIDHVLIDEAQDTSPAQWEIIFRLISEFTAGEGARGSLHRTVFAVGDEKQSIFSFQGADVSQFDMRRRTLERRYHAAAMRFHNVRLNYSFRSGQNLLDAVDAVFSSETMARSVSAGDTAPPSHKALEDAAPGFVQLWDVVKSVKSNPDPWTAPLDAQSETSAPVQLAQQVAKHVAQSLERDAVANYGRPKAMTAGDILILVRKRGALFEAIIRALKDRGVPVAGADRLALTEHVAVRDMMALADAILLPSDDLALATALKSPLFALDDEDLLALAPQRRGSLREALAASPTARHHDAATKLARWAEAASTRSAYGFFAWLLGAEGGRRTMLARLGNESNDPLDEFLGCALDFDRREAPTLQGFMAWLRAADIVIKRDMELQRPEVRVMTVHGAKGLEAPVVYLLDTASPPGGRAASLIETPADAVHPAAVLWKGSKGNEPQIMVAARAQAEAAELDEHRRLLYVAMTRAAERLHVCAAAGARDLPAQCWYRLIETALTGANTLVPIPAEEGGGRRFERPDDAMPARPPADAQADAVDTLPAFALTPASGAVPRARLTPSGAGDKMVELTPRRQAAMRRGTAIHRLLQLLPDVDTSARAVAASRWLAGNAPELAPEHEALVRDVSAMVDHPAFADVFGPDSLAEVPIVGRFPRRDGTIPDFTGQADRICLTGNAVLVVDFKSGTPADPVPTDYVRQLALYRHALQRAWPGRAVRAAVVWTEGPALIEIDAKMMDMEIAKELLPDATS